MFCEVIGVFDILKNQYIFVIDVVFKENFDCFFLLKSVLWKMILDFDFLFEEEGFYIEFMFREG